jgi:uncharacterized protein (TIGR03083 family)
MTIDQSTRQRPRGSALDHALAMRLAATEYARVVTLLEQLTPEQWAAPTECPGWDVRAMAGHVLGMAKMAASIPETVRQQRAAGKVQKREGGLPIDALTAVQVEKNAGLSTAELVGAMRRVGPKATRSRGRTPALVRSRAFPQPQDVGGVEESWTFGFLFDTILTRDPFMHRVDIARATGTTLQVTADHEGVIVDDVVREWADRHGAPYDVELTGPAGGHWGDGDEQIRMDALEFCRVVSGRGAGTGLLATLVPF